MDGSSTIPAALIDSSCDSGTCMLETYYLNFIARQLYVQKCLKYRKIQYWHAGLSVPIQEQHGLLPLPGRPGKHDIIVKQI